MDVQQAILRRRSIRRYTAKDIPSEKLEQILQAGLLAPSGRNKRPVELIVVRDKAVLAKLAHAKATGAALLEGAACAIVVIGDSEKSDTWVEDASLAMGFMQLRAVELALGSCWVHYRGRVSPQEGVMAEDCVRQILNIPARYGVLAALALGFPAEAPPLHTAAEAGADRLHREVF